MSNIRALFERYKRSVFEKDVDEFVSIFDEQVRIFDMWHWSYDGRAAWRTMAEGWFASLGTERVVVTFDEIQIESIGDMGHASAFARFAAIDESGTELRYLQNRLTWILQRKDDTWKIIHEHTSGPVDGKTMKVALKR